jgi:hypothetical protein
MITTIDVSPDSNLEWRDIAGYEGIYQISSTGIVRSVDRFRYGTSARIRGQVLSTHTEPTGHKRLRLYRDADRGKGYRVHHLVLCAFVGPRPDGMEACHNDGDPANNCVSNLRWDTRTNNIYDAVQHGTHYWAAKTHCKRGHEFSAANTRVYRGSRFCRACVRLRGAEMRARRAAA